MIDREKRAMHATPKYKVQLAPCQRPPSSIVANKLRYRRAAPYLLPPSGK